VTAEPIWIDELDILTLHDRLLAFHGGAGGVRDGRLLQSALARARQLAAYGDSVDVIGMATAYTAGIVKNHRSWTVYRPRPEYFAITQSNREEAGKISALSKLSPQS